MSDSYSAAKDLADTVTMLMTEPRPLARPVTRLKKRSELPIDKARLVFDAAVQYVDVCIDCDAVADWERRQERLNGWLEALCGEPTPMSVEQFGANMIASQRVNRTELEAALVGTRHWAALLDDVSEILAQHARRCEDTGHTHQVMGMALERVGIIMKRCGERHAEISMATEVRLQGISSEDAPARESAMDAGHRDLIVLSETVCEQINAQTRRVLNAHRHTAAMPLWQFWEMAYKDLIEG